MKIAHVWQGVSDQKTYGHWNDGLRAALRIIEKEHEVVFREPWDDIRDVDIILYHEAPCTINGSNASHYNKVRLNPIKKCLLFAGGPIERKWIEGFDHVFVESKINKDQLDALGISNSTAFGVDTDIFKPSDVEKKWDGIHHGTSASWKRQHLGAEALKDKMLVVGRRQDTDSFTFDESAKWGTTILPEQSHEKVAELLNQSVCLVQTSSEWGGGQRATLESLACNVPVICMTDSPKNREYVEESGFGLVVKPEPEAIKRAVDEIKNWPKSNKGREYVLSKFTAQHYADNILKIIERL